MRTGQSLRAVRRRRGLTLDELSALCGVSRDDLGKYERGQMTPRPGTVARIALALDIPIADISQGMGWTAPAPAEGWEAPAGDPLHDSILEMVKELQGEEFTLSEDDLRLLMESVKAAIPSMVEHLKDVRPVAEINREILEELDVDLGGNGEQYALTDEQWAQISPLLPPERAGRGRAFKSNRLMLDGILYHLKSGTAWKALPERFGRFKCVSDRLRLWQSTGVWEAVLDKLRELGILDTNQ